MKVLVVAAHFDDELLGLGATLIKHKEQGDDIYICICTTGLSDKWSKEYTDLQLQQAKKIDQELGVSQRFLCNFEPAELNTLPFGDINKMVNDIVDKVGPDLIYTHYWDDVNRDHKIVFEAVMVSTRPINTKVAVSCFETPSSSEWGYSSFKPNKYVAFNEDILEQKVKLFEIYESEVKVYPHPRSRENLYNLASVRGSEISEHYAEAFIIVKDYWL